MSKKKKKYRLIWLFSALNCAAKNSSKLQRQLFTIHNSSYNCQTGLKANHNWMKFFLMEILILQLPSLLRELQAYKSTKIAGKKQILTSHLNQKTTSKQNSSHCECSKLKQRNEQTRKIILLGHFLKLEGASCQVFLFRNYYSHKKFRINTFVFKKRQVLKREKKTKQLLSSLKQKIEII